MRELPEDAAQETLFDMLHFDHYLRQRLIEEWEVPPASAELLLGRPLSRIIRHLGIKAEMTGEGFFHLEVKT